MRTHTELAFNGVTFEIHHLGAIECIPSGQIAQALGYAQERSLLSVYSRASDEFSEHMTGIVKLPTPRGIQSVRVFSLRGAHLLGMLSKTEQAKRFRRWVLDVIEAKESAPTIPVDLYAQALQAETAEARSFALASAGSRAMLLRKHEKAELVETLAMMREAVQLRLQLGFAPLQIGGAA